MIAENIMTQDVVCVDESTKIRELLKILHDQHISGAPVLNDGGKLSGIVSEKDIIRARLQSLHHIDQHEDLHDLFTPISSEVQAGINGSVTRYNWVAQIMTRNVVTVRPDTEIKEVALLMLKHHFHRLPVVDTNNKIVGIITTIDMIELLV